VREEKDERKVPQSQSCGCAGRSGSFQSRGHRYDQEGTLFADLDLAEIARSKFDFDVTGHYARPDVFKLTVNEKPALPVVYHTTDEP